MSLIVAKAVSGHIYCMGDTKITYKNEANSNPILNGCLKQYIFNELLICFAGCVDSFECDINDYRACKSTEDAINIAIKRAINYDLIIAAPGDPYITTVKNRTTLQSTTGFIGDHKAFEAFQNYYHNPQALTSQPGYGEIRILRIPEPSDNLHDYDRTYMALRSVVIDSAIDSVGGAVVSVATNHGGIYSQTKSSPLNPVKFKLFNLELRKAGAAPLSFQIFEVTPTQIHSRPFIFFREALVWFFKAEAVGQVSPFLSKLKTPVRGLSPLEKISIEQPFPDI